MKISNLVFVAVISFVCGGQVQADIIPSIDKGSAECHRWADSHIDNTAYHAAAKHRCNTFDGCIADSSVNQDELHRCIVTAEAKFIEQTEGVVPGNTQGTSPDLITPVSTEAVESEYYHPDRDKGFDFSKQE